MSTPFKLVFAAVVVLASVGASWYVFNSPHEPAVAPPLPIPMPEPKPTVAPKNTISVSTDSSPSVSADGSIPANAAALRYRAPKDRGDDMQMFDKAVLYLMDVQDPDGHIDSARTGAAPEFQNLNNDIALTSIAAWVMMGSSSAQNQNPEAVARARKAVRWLESKTQPDGTIGDVNGPGEAVLAQLFACDAFRMAVSYSTRESLRAETSRLNSVALRKMSAANGGYGSKANSAEPRADMIALASFVFKFAGYDGFKFDSVDTTKKPASKAAFPIEDEILDNLRAGMKRLESAPVFAEKAGGPSDWRSTVCGMQAAFMINPSKTTVTPALEFVFGPFDKATESYPRVLQHVAWGKSGEGYDALALWQGSIAVVYMFTEDKYESKTWMGNVRSIFRTHQAPDGSWPVAGEDGKRGRAWRTGLHAMTLALIAPPPPPAAPPADDTPPAK